LGGLGLDEYFIEMKPPQQILVTKQRAAIIGLHLQLTEILVWVLFSISFHINYIILETLVNTQSLSQKLVHFIVLLRGCLSSPSAPLPLLLFWIKIDIYKKLYFLDIFAKAKTSLR